MIVFSMYCSIHRDIIAVSWHLKRRQWLCIGICCDSYSCGIEISVGQVDRNGHHSLAKSNLPSHSQRLHMECLISRKRRISSAPQNILGDGQCRRCAFNQRAPLVIWIVWQNIILSINRKVRAVIPLILEVFVGWFSRRLVGS